MYLSSFGYIYLESFTRSAIEGNCNTNQRRLHFEVLAFFKQDLLRISCRVKLKQPNFQDFPVNSSNKTIRKEPLPLYFFCLTLLSQLEGIIPKRIKMCPQVLIETLKNQGWRCKLFSFSFNGIHLLKPSSLVKSKKKQQQQKTWAGE